LPTEPKDGYVERRNNSAPAFDTALEISDRRYLTSGSGLARVSASNVHEGHSPSRGYTRRGMLRG